MNNIFQNYTGYFSGIFPSGGSVIPSSLAVSYQILFENLKNECPPEKALPGFANNLGFQNPEELLPLLSAEQADSVYLASRALATGGVFTIADKTGLGKGRILAAILRMALNNGKKILFVSEKANLFNDFWRDIFDLKADQILNPKDVLMLTRSKVVIHKNNEPYTSTLKAKEISEIVQQKNLNFRCVMTTFSQLSGENGKARLNYLKEFIKDGYVLFDEFHNLVGAASVVKTELEQSALGSVHSSATMMNKASQLHNFYQDLNLDEDFLPGNFDSHLKNHENIYSEFIGKMMVRSGKMLRREHAYIMEQNIVEADEKTEQKVNHTLSQFGQFLIMVIQCRDDILVKSGASIKDRTSAQSKFWLKYGNKIARTVKTLLTLSLADFACERVEQALSENKKVVLILRSTFSTLVQESHEYQKKKNKPIKLDIQALMQSYIYDITEDYPEWFKDEKWFEVTEALEIFASKFPSIPLSVIDNLKEKINARTGEEVLEISGRSHYVKHNKDGDELLSRTEDLDRPKTISRFNNGEDNKDFNVIILTAAGSTGLSLHAYSKFKDQRIRRMIELEISPMTFEREQFFGRINRTGQTTLPELETIRSNHPTSLRIAINENNKLRLTRKMIASGAQVESSDLFNDSTEWAARHFLAMNPKLSSIINIKPNKPSDIENPYGFLSSVLARSFMMSEEEKAVLMDMLAKAQSNHKQTETVFTKGRVFKDTDFQSVQTKKLYAIGDVNNKQRILERLKNGTPELFLLDVVMNQKATETLKPAPTDALLFPHLSFSTDTIYGKNVVERYQQNIAMLRSITLGSTISFRLDGCLVNGVVVGGLSDIDYPYPEFQSIEIAVSSNSDGAYQEGEKITVPLNYLASNLFLQTGRGLNSKEEKRLSIVVGHPMLITWLLSIHNQYLGYAELESSIGESYPALIIPSVIRNRLVELFEHLKPVNKEDELKKILQSDSTIINAGGSFSIKMSGNSATLRILAQHMESDTIINQKNREKIIEMGKKLNSNDKGHLLFSLPKNAALSIAFSYFYSERGQWFTPKANFE